MGKKNHTSRQLSANFSVKKLFSEKNMYICIVKRLLTIQNQTNYEEGICICSYVRCCSNGFMWWPAEGC